KSDRAGESEIDWRRERDRTSESALSRSDWVCWNVRLKMRIFLMLSVSSLLVCSNSCEREASGSKAITESAQFDEQITALDLREKDAELAELRNELKQLRSEFRILEDELIVEARSRLTAIESNHAEAIRIEQERYELLEILQNADREFAEKVEKEVQRNKEFLDAVAATDPGFAFTDAKSYVEQIKILLLEVSEGNKALRAELEALEASD
ncbi:hypothetical protein, partial [Roseibacillus persicicus]